MSSESLPESVEICEVGPRDGFQFESEPIPTELKLEVIRGLVAAGVSRIQVTSFVHPGKVPQMSDAEEVVDALLADARPMDVPPTDALPAEALPAEALLVDKLPAKADLVDKLPAKADLAASTIFTGLCLNMRGIQRAADSGLRCVDISIATNERHGEDNAGMTIEAGVEQAEKMISEATRLGLRTQLGLQTVFGYKNPGDTPLDLVIALCKRFAEMPIESLSLADSTGLANPEMMKERLGAIRGVTGDVPIVLHLHDTRGLGLVNLMAALETGVNRFDTSLGGLGGCPFIPGATGNIATEEVVYLCDGLGIETGIDVAAVARQSRRMAEFLGRSLSGKLYRLL